MIKKLFLLVLLLSIASICFAQGESEQLTITTYYPSPYGVYKQLRLFPNDDPGTCDSNKEGTLYYDQSEQAVKVCRITSSGAYGWEIPPGEDSGEAPSGTWCGLCGDGYSNLVPCMGKNVCSTTEPCPAGWRKITPSSYLWGTTTADSICVKDGALPPGGGGGGPAPTPPTIIHVW